MDETNTANESWTNYSKSDEYEKEKTFAEMAEKYCEERYKSNAPDVRDWNDLDYWDHVPKELRTLDKPQQEIYTFSEKLTPELTEKILTEFHDSAKMAGLRPTDHPKDYERSFWGEIKECPILCNADLLSKKMAEVFGNASLTEEENPNSDAGLILGCVKAEMPSRNFEWKNSALYVDGARTNITYQSLAEIIVEKLRRVF